MVLSWMAPLLRRMAGDLAHALSARVDTGSRGNARAEIARGGAHSDRRTAPWLPVPPPAGDPPAPGPAS